MSDGAAVLMAAQYAMLAKGFWRDEREANFLDGAAPFYGNYECADGRYVSIGSIEPQFYRELLDRCGIVDPEFLSQWDSAHWPALKAKLATMFRTRTRDHWCELLEGSEACFAPVLSMSEAPHHAHNAARRTFVEAAGGVQPAPAPRFDRTVSELPCPAPPVGNDSLELLRSLGYSETAIEELIGSAVVYQPPEKGS